MVIRAIPTRVVMHVGFHCTEMAAAHAFLRHNRVPIRRHAAFVLDQKLRPAVTAARAYSEDPEPFNRQRFQFRFIALLGDVPVQHNKPLLISHPGLLGHMPGAGGVQSYAMAADLCEDMADSIRQAFGKGVEVVFVLTLQAPDVWLNRAWQRLRNNKMTDLGETEFSKTYAGAADLAGVAGMIQSRLASLDGVSVQTVDVTPVLDAAFGPGGLYIDALPLPSRSYEKLSGPGGAEDLRPMSEKMKPYRQLT